MQITQRLRWSAGLFFLVFTALAIACTTQPTPVPATPIPATATAEPEAMTEPTEEPTAAPTATDAPPTPPRVPTATPEPAPTATTEPTAAPTEPAAAPTEPAAAPTEPAAAPTDVLMEADPADVVSIILNEQNASGQTGWASLIAQGDQTAVILSLSEGNLETELVHIHSGQCGDALGGIAHDLTSFTDGSGASITTVNASLSSLRTGDFAINSHKKGEPGVYTACANIPTPAESLTIALNQQNDSGQSGWATLTARGDQTEVLLTISSGDLETELVHIHAGQCGDALGGIAHDLTSFADGSGASITMVDASLSSLRTGDFAINSHKAGDPGVYTACGNIPSPAESLTIALNQQNDSGQSGWATLTARGDQTEVLLTISSGTLETELVHIHSGQCGDALGGIAHDLTSFADGSGASITTVNASLSSLRTGDFAINSHKKGEPGVYTACANIPTPAESLTIALNQQNDSGQSGWATLTARGDQTEVLLTISSGDLETELVHIHAGQCGDALGGIAHDLTSFADGSGASITTVDASLSSLRAGDFAINSHKAGDPGVYTACGNIPAGEPLAVVPKTEMTVVTLSNFRFSPAVLEVQAGEKARFSVSSEGSGHTFTIPTMGLDVVLAAGTQRTVEFEVPEGTTGEIQFLCRFHSSGGTGMVGQLRVTGSNGTY